MPTIHPSAIIEGDVQLADDVFIGPWCCLKGPITLGAGTRLLRRVELYGPLTVGQANLFYPGACVGFAPQDRSFHPDTPGAGVAIGSHNVFREFVTVHRATKDTPTTIGDHVYLMASSHVAHDCRVDDHVTMANSALLGGHVRVETRAFLGGNSAVHQHCRVGELAMLGGGATVTADLPPFCTAIVTKRVSALNLIGLRRNGLRDHVANLKAAFDILFRQRHTNPVACDLIDQQFPDDPRCRQFTAFVRTSKRGVTSHRAADDE